MTSSLALLRTHFEQALLNWLRSTTAAPITGEKLNALEALLACIKQCREIEPYDPYWPYGQSALEALIQNKTTDHIAYRKVIAQINLLLAKKIQQPLTLAPKQLWHDTFMLKAIVNEHHKPISITDAFLRDAEDHLQHLEQAILDWQKPQTIHSIDNSARTILALAVDANLGLLTTLANALHRLSTTLLQSELSLKEDEYRVLATTHRSMRALLHQAAAGTMLKQDDLFVDALFGCEQATAMHHLAKFS